MKRNDGGKREKSEIREARDSEQGPVKRERERERERERRNERHGEVERGQVRE